MRTRAFPIERKKALDAFCDALSQSVFFFADLPAAQKHRVRRGGTFFLVTAIASGAIAIVLAVALARLPLHVALSVFAAWVVVGAIAAAAFTGIRVIRLSERFSLLESPLYVFYRDALWRVTFSEAEPRRLSATEAAHIRENAASAVHGLSNKELSRAWKAILAIDDTEIGNSNACGAQVERIDDIEDVCVENSPEGTVWKVTGEIDGEPGVIELSEAAGERTVGQWLEHGFER